ncbi:MAG: CRISPR system precrRNA processing endoribonuclease RAMP protein Cas6 [Dehalococcoidia bacterium]
MEGHAFLPALDQGRFAAASRPTQAVVDHLVALVAFLGALGVGPRPAPVGLDERGLFFRLLRAHAPEMGDALHDGSERRPYAVSPLLDADTRVPAVTVWTGERYAMRLSFLHRDGVMLYRRCWGRSCVTSRSAAVRSALVPASRSTSWAPCAWDFADDGDAAAPEETDSFAALLEPPWAARWAIGFLTRTSFQPALAPAERATAPWALELPFPVPDLIRRGLGRLWAGTDRELGWAPTPLAPIAAEPAVAAITRHVQVKDLALMHAPVAERRADRDFTRTAFTGTVTRAYVRGHQEENDERQARLQLLAALLRLAPYSGVGVQTTRGMGMVATAPAPRSA